jgi:NAD(P)-dependent dehydrogenase (short-subunit alcohol dehydrogenase family)
MSLSGKRVVILGGTSGIGLATAKAAERERRYVHDAPLSATASTSILNP